MDRKLHSDDDELLLELLHGEADELLLEELSQRAANRESFGERISEELRFSEWLRQVLREQGGAVRDPGTVWKGDLVSAALEESELVARVCEGDATVFECDQLTKRLWEKPDTTRDLRRRLAEDEWLREAVSRDRSEQAFLESLQTRMWAETKEDHFVDDFANLLDREMSLDTDSTPPDNIVSFSSGWPSTVLRLLTAAAVVGIGAFLAGQVVARRMAAPGSASVASVGAVVKSTDDARWGDGTQPDQEGRMLPGVYELSRGIVSMRLSGGADLTVQGPARFEISPDATAEVLSGIALAKASDGDTGVRLRSRGLSISKTTQFVGIDARDTDRTEAIVLGGGAGVCLTTSGKCRALSEFEAVQVDHFRDKLVDVPYNPRAFSKAWAMVAGVEDNLGPVRVELPGLINASIGEESGDLRVVLENESFRLSDELQVDSLPNGSFAVAEANHGASLAPDSELRSYLLQVPSKERSGRDNGERETSLTFDHPIVGIIFSQDRLESSDAVVGATSIREQGLIGRGLTSGEDEILLSEDRRTINLRLRGDGEMAEQVRVIVALK